MSGATGEGCGIVFILLLIMLAGSVARAENILSISRVLPSATVELRDPRSLSISPNGTLYIADTGRHRVLAVDPIGQVIAETGGLGREHGQFQWPTKVIADRGAAVWVLDFGNRRIEKFSRSLEYQGTFLLPSNEKSLPCQIEEFAVTPQGDMYVYDRDGGRLMRLDPLFRVQAELGHDRGAQFVSALSRMTFVDRLGLAWWERGSEMIRVSDPLFAQIDELQLTVGAPKTSMVLSAVDTCLAFGSVNGFWRWCGEAKSPDSLFNLASQPDLALKRLDDIAFVDRHAFYVLDGATGAVYLVSVTER